MISLFEGETIIRMQLHSEKLGKWMPIWGLDLPFPYKRWDDFLRTNLQMFEIGLGIKRNQFWGVGLRMFVEEMGK